MWNLSGKSPLTDWDKNRKKKLNSEEELNRKDRRAIMKLVRKFDPVANMLYKEWRRYYRRPKVQRNRSTWMLIVYNLSDLMKLLKKYPKLKWIHFTGTLSQTNYKWTVALLKKGVIRFFTVAPWSHCRLLQRKWYQGLAADLFNRVGTFCARTKKVWTDALNTLVAGWIKEGTPFKEICAQLYNLYAHKITVRALIRMAVVKHWIPLPRASLNKHFKKKPPYRRPERPPPWR